jgi:hypothetical protein
VTLTLKLVKTVSWSAGRRSWALARRSWAEQYSLESVVSECSSPAARKQGLLPAGDINMEAEGIVSISCQETTSGGYSKLRRLIASCSDL